MKDKLHTIRRYCDYVEAHIGNVQKAWEILQVALKSENVIYDDFLFHQIDAMIKAHDSSKFSKEEFIPYADYFFGDRDAPGVKDAFNVAWEHHKAHNPHHWEVWPNTPQNFPNHHACHVVCMVADWMAMGMQFGDTAEDYYRKNEKKIIIPYWSRAFLEGVFLAIRPPKEDAK